MTKAELLKKADSLPLEPGVYIMMDKTGQVIYVGKAKKLKNRVSQYFQAGRGHNEKTRAMVASVDHFDTIVVRTEFEALILENSLIKRHQPHYNILLKDDKGYPFVRLNKNEPYPRFSLVSKPGEDGAAYYGPFGGRHETHAAIDAVCNLLKLPTCSRRFPRDIGRERPCLNYHIGKCDGWCLPEGPGAEEYARRIARGASLFEGRLPQLRRQLESEMNEAAEALAFEKAASLRDQMRALAVLTKQQQVIAGICADTDIWGLFTGQVRTGAAVLHIENGDLLSREVQVFPTGAEEGGEDVLAAVLSQYYLGRPLLPREIMVPFLWEGSDTFAALLTANAGRKVIIHAPQRGQRADLVEMAERNAREEVERITTDFERTNRTLQSLETLAALPRFPHRMESYDISNTGSDDMVASMVVFQDGKPLKRDYRKFAIKTLTAPNDYAAMEEVLTRRFTRYLEGDPKFAPLPDVLLIDGGLGHAHAAWEAVSALGLDVPILGMVKDDRHRTRALVTLEGQELGIQNNPPLFAMLGRVQEEVHRFAITFHREKHRKSAYRSRLDNIPGLGEKRKAEVRKHFGTVKAISEATVEELAAVLPRNVAENVYARFHEKDGGEKE
ncbi:MAG: excinuclease ABC subunit UvrC [Oscillospiraceae bacterium]|nr:excinuclease ABC subunit UvrC [Oscillospiraceae bacterium]